MDGCTEREKFRGGVEEFNEEGRHGEVMIKNCSEEGEKVVDVVLQMKRRGRQIASRKNNFCEPRREENSGSQYSENDTLGLEKVSMTVSFQIVHTEKNM